MRCFIGNMLINKIGETHKMHSRLVSNADFPLQQTAKH